MEAVDSRILSIIDRLAHDSTTDQDALNSVYGLRRVVKGETPSSLLSKSVHPKSKELSNLKKLVTQLRTDLVEQADANDALESEKAELERQLGLLRSEQGRPSTLPRRDPLADYSYDEVITILRGKFGKVNGGQTLWAAFSLTLNADKIVTVSLLQKFRRANAYPAWAIDQLQAMPTVIPSCHRWSTEDIDYLCNLHLADPRKGDDELAAECSMRFDCVINSNSIKSKFNILRKEGRIAPRRPAAC